jgi:ABC-type antimicrobial peptide transport system permease subunit
MKPTPPRKALKFLRWFCREDCIEEIEGDLTEVFEKQYEESPSKARMKFTWSVIKYFRPEFIKSFKRSYHPNPISMFHHNFLITYRNFLRYKSSFFINLIGLSTGLASVLLIYLWVHDELSFDKFHEKDNRLFQVLRNTPGPSNTIETHGSNSTLLPSALVSEMPDVEYVVPMRSAPPGIVSAGKERVKATGMFAGKDFFKVFSYNIIQGNRDHVLDDKYGMIISDELGVKLFGSLEGSLGKTIIWDLDNFGGTYVVSGVFEKSHQNSSEKFDFLVTHEAFLEKNKMDASWDSNPISVCLTLKPDVNVDEFNRKINIFYQSKRKADPNWITDSMFLQPYSDRYLYNHFENGKQAGGRIDYVVLFSIIALFILAIACINFMNLSTARASRRLKEVGVKKAIGVLRKTLIAQHLGESMMMATLALITGVIFVFLLLPEFNLITGKHLTLGFDWKLLYGALTITFFTGLISGGYPAFYLSGFRPVEVLKNKLSTSMGELWVRKGLVIFQFSISILLIVAVVIIYLQLNFVQSKNLGYKKDNVITFERQGNLNSGLESFLSEVKNIDGVINASSVSGSVTNINSTSWGHTWEGQLVDAPVIEFTGVNVNYDFIETLSIEMMKGRSFSKDFGSEESKVILNEAAVAAMQLADPIGKWIQLFEMKREIIGVVKDFHFQSMYEEIKPIFILCNPKYTNTVIVKIQSHTSRTTISKLEDLYHRHNPGIAFEIQFLDDEYQALYVAEQRVASLSKYFAIIAIVISCLGLFGLAAFTAERRTKEIGIRKILGCSELRIIRMLSADFTMMVLIAIIIALPVSYLIAKYWLEGFAYRVDLEWWFFIGAGLMALVIAWFTVGMQTIKAARINPALTLKEE